MLIVYIGIIEYSALFLCVNETINNRVPGQELIREVSSTSGGGKMAILRGSTHYITSGPG